MNDAPSNWRLVELANGRSPRGRKWRGLREEERERLLPDEAAWRALARYTALHCTRRAVDHETAYKASHGRADRHTERLLQQLLMNGTLTIGEKS
jgi:hypothetical protein